MGTEAKRKAKQTQRDAKERNIYYFFFKKKHYPIFLSHKHTCTRFQLAQTSFIFR